MRCCSDFSCSLQYLLEQSRISFQAPDERNYHVFYQLLAGGDKQQYLLDDIKSYKYLNQSGCYKLDDVDDSKSFEQLCMALTGNYKSFYIFHLWLTFHKC